MLCSAGVLPSGEKRLAGPEPEGDTCAGAALYIQFFFSDCRPPKSSKCQII